MILIKRASFYLASIEISTQNSKQLKAISIRSLLSSRCCEWSWV